MRRSCAAASGRALSLVLSPRVTIIPGRTVKASFIPGDLHLSETQDGSHIVVMQGTEILRTRSQKTAAAKFNELRREMETKYPATEMTPEEKADIFRRATVDAMIGHNSLGGRKKKTTAGGTRTFGG